MKYWIVQTVRYVFISRYFIFGLCKMFVTGLLKCIQWKRIARNARGR